MNDFEHRLQKIELVLAALTTLLSQGIRDVLKEDIRQADESYRMFLEDFKQ